MTDKAPLLLVVMGVSGSGKSSLSKALSTALGLGLMDGDDLHTPECVRKMRAGIALEDADRWPWLDRIASYLKHGDVQNNVEAAGKVVACSALKRVYRDRLRQATPGVQFIFLDGDSDLIRGRMASRHGHYMQLALLDSQLRTLERPTADEKDVRRFDIGLSVEHLVIHITSALQNKK